MKNKDMVKTEATNIFLYFVIVLIMIIVGAFLLFSGNIVRLIGLPDALPVQEIFKENEQRLKDYLLIIYSLSTLIYLFFCYLFIDFLHYSLSSLINKKIKLFSFMYETEFLSTVSLDNQKDKITKLIKTISTTQKWFSIFSICFLLFIFTISVIPASNYIYQIPIYLLVFFTPIYSLIYVLNNNKKILYSIEDNLNHNNLSLETANIIKNNISSMKLDKKIPLFFILCVFSSLFINPYYMVNPFYDKTEIQNIAEKEEADLENDSDFQEKDKVMQKTEARNLNPLPLSFLLYNKVNKDYSNLHMVHHALPKSVYEFEFEKNKSNEIERFKEIPIVDAYLNFDNKIIDRLISFISSILILIHIRFYFMNKKINKRINSIHSKIVNNIGIKPD